MVDHKLNVRGVCVCVYIITHRFQVIACYIIGERERQTEMLL